MPLKELSEMTSPTRKLKATIPEWALFDHETKASASREAALLIAAALDNDSVELDAWERSETDVVIRPVVPGHIAERLENLAKQNGVDIWDVATSILRHQLRHKEVAIQQQIAEAAAIEAEKARELDARSAWIEKRAHEIATGSDRPTVSLQEDDKRIYLRFPYDELALAWVKLLPGAKWDKAKRAWHISVRYRKRVEAMLVEIEAAIALKWAEVERDFHDDPPPASLVTIEAVKGHIQARFKFDMALVERLRRLKKRGIAWQDKRDHHIWICSYRNRRYFYELAADYPLKVAEMASS